MNSQVGRTSVSVTCDICLCCAVHCQSVQDGRHVASSASLFPRHLTEQRHNSPHLCISNTQTVGFTLDFSNSSFVLDA